MSLRTAQSLSRAMFVRSQSTAATFYRGGTSKAVIFLDQHLPQTLEQRVPIFRSAIGSPDPNGRQLNGMGGGLSSTSKVVVVNKSAREGADVEYTFVQVGVKDGLIDYGSNCGNMLAAVGPFALENALIAAPLVSNGSATVRIYNTNTNKIIHATFPVTSQHQPLLDGDFAIDGVAGTSAKIALDFISPGGSRTGKLLPTGRALDILSVDTVPGYQGPPIKISLVDCANPCAFIDANDLVDFDATILPADLEKDRNMLDILEQIRRGSLVLMGLASSIEEAAKVRSIPKVCIVALPTDHRILSGATLSASNIDLVIRCMSSGDPHRALPITAALCVAAAAQTEGTIVNAILSTRGNTQKGVTLGHPSGTISVGASMGRDEQGHRSVEKAQVLRTARKLFEGKVFH